MDDQFKGLKIGPLALRNNLVSAPLAGLSSLPYRILAMEMGCALAISEMVSAEGVIRGRNRTSRYFENDPAARPFGVQLFGAKPEMFARAIEGLEGLPIDLIDINMGCPVKKVCSRGAGAALMREPALAAKIIETARRSTAKPITVKIRSGWDDGSINCVEIAKIAEGSGADCVTIHPRTKIQEFKGMSDWRHIASVKRAVSIPVIGNGDVRTRADAVRMLSETGCDAVMIGRGALGNPWIFRAILDEDYAGPTRAERGMAAVRHLEMLGAMVGVKHAVMNFKAALPWYAKGIGGVKTFLRQAMVLTNYDEFKKTIEIYFNEIKDQRSNNKYAYKISNI